MKLESARGPVEILAIDHSERPMGLTEGQFPRIHLPGVYRMNGCKICTDLLSASRQAPLLDLGRDVTVEKEAPPSPYPYTPLSQ
jgi:hypothetical protein